MTPQDHYVEAERLLNEILEVYDHVVAVEGAQMQVDKAKAHYLGFLVALTRAQVHAILATATGPRTNPD